MLNKALVAAMFAALTVGAQAQVTGGIAANQDPTSFITLSAANVTGGALYDAAHTYPGYAARPQDVGHSIVTEGNWLAAGPIGGQNQGDAMVSFETGTQFVSFLWGSPDTYNSVVVHTTNGDSKTFDSSNLGGLLYFGNQDYASYVGFSADQGSGLIDKLTFVSRNSNAFEASNFSVAAPVPEPETYALMLVGLAAVAFVVRRRKI